MKLYLILLIVLVTQLTACAQRTIEKKPVKVEKPVVVEQVPVEKKEPVKPKDVYLLLSSDAGPYLKLAEHISNSIGKRAHTLILTGKASTDKATFEKIKVAGASQVVAIGLKAAKVSRALTSQQVLFAQVVNYQDYNLLADNMQGVSALPAPEKLFKDWKAISPGLSKVAVVVGKNMDVYLKRAKEAASNHGVELVVKVVKTDKEFLYRSKNLKPNIEGQWILPDNRVLSGKVLKDVMSHGSRRGRQIVVFSPKLLSFGGLLYVSSDLKAVSSTVVKQLEDLESEITVTGDSVLPVMNHTMGINRNIAQQFNLKIPQKYRKYIDGD